MLRARDFLTTGRLRLPGAPAALACALAVAGCAGETARPSLEPTRGYLLISIDTLRADHLGVYGYSLPTSPFLDALASRGVVFEHAVAHLPGTLPSHVSIFTGLYPPEHGVYPPDGVLSPEIETLPELFSAHGFRTGGFTESGYVAGKYGFERGFEVFDDRIEGAPDDVERTVSRGLDFLRGLGPGDPYFLFLHTYAVHDPYRPLEPYASRFGARLPADAFEPTGPNLAAFNRGDGTISPAALDAYRAAYDASIGYVDDVLRGFFDELEALGLADDLTVVITSDHGEEFLDHGKMAHKQTYRETLHVPLIVVHPDLEPGRVPELVRSVDIAPTLAEIAGFEPWPRRISGRSFVGLLRGGDPAWPAEAYGESFGRQTRTLFLEEDGDLYQYLETDAGSEGPGTWVIRRIDFDVLGETLEFSALSYHRPRVLTVSYAGDVLERVEIGPDRWTRVTVGLPEGPRRKRIALSTDGCDVPRKLGENRDQRCLSFRVRGLSLRKLELFDLRRDPQQRRDLSALREASLRGAARKLGGYELEPVAPAETLDVDPELERRLRGLGYLE